MVNVADDGTQRGSVIDYNADFERNFKQERTFSAFGVPNDVGINKQTTYYIGKDYEKIVETNGTIKHRYTINTGGGSIQIERLDNSVKDQPKYLLTDNLGSTNVILNSLGEVEQRLEFDPWGMRVAGPEVGVVNSITNKGYTGHETDDEVGLINMNARVYDPYLGRFMSADPVLPDASNMQSFNRYAYVENNPLKYTDPTGNIKRCLGCAGAPAGGIGAEGGPDKLARANAEPIDNKDGTGVEHGGGGGVLPEGTCLNGCDFLFEHTLIPVEIGDGNILVGGSTIAGSGRDVFSTSIGVGSGRDPSGVDQISAPQRSQNTPSPSPQQSSNGISADGLVDPALGAASILVGVPAGTLGFTDVSHEFRFYDYDSRGRFVGNGSLTTIKISPLLISRFGLVTTSLATINSATSFESGNFLSYSDATFIAVGAFSARTSPHVYLISEYVNFTLSQMVEGAPPNPRNYNNGGGILGPISPSFRFDREDSPVNLRFE